MVAIPRMQELRRRRKRKEKLRKLRKKYLEAKTQAEKNLIWEKVGRIAPWLSIDEFLLKH
ncbi:MAG: DUF6800 family protein [Candidatus Paceibacteria bacterium]